MRISKSTKTSVKASKVIRFNDYWDFVYQNSKLSREEAKAICVDCWNHGKSREDALALAQKSYTNEDSVDACGDIKSSTDTDKALQHIKAAIDILGTSGDKSDVTKDSIANLATVMFDIKANKQN